MPDRMPDCTHACMPRPLVVRCGALGDMVLLTPLLALLHQRYGLAADVLGAGAWTAPLYAGHPDVHRVLLLGSRKRPYWTDPRQWRAVAQLRSGGRRPVYVCDELATAPLARLLVRAGFDDGDLLWIGAHPECARTHWVERWLAFGALDAPRWPGAAQASTEAAPRLFIGASAVADCDAWLARRGWAGRPLLLLHAGNKRT
ncbi:MAG: glycosyltransferase family 9 protein, partial [Metallibacterium scheffleri]